MHNRQTRLSSAKELHSQKFNTTTYGLSSLRYPGTKALNTLKNDPLFNNETNKKYLKRLFSNETFDSLSAEFDKSSFHFNGTQGAQPSIQPIFNKSF